MTLRDAIEIAILFAAIYAVLRFLQGTRGAGILKGLVLLLGIAFVVVFAVTQRLRLQEIDFLLKEFLTVSLFALVVLFQPELRRGLMRLGQNPFVGKFLRGESTMVEEVVKAVAHLSKDKIGALIAVEREIGLGTYVEGGVSLDAEVSSDLLDTIFWPGSALHDGAVVIQNERLAAAGCLFPLSENPEVSKRLGTRHRAALGLTEETDAVTVVVSEETGKISVGVRGHLEQDLDRESLRRILRELLTENVKRAERLTRAAS
ncbi:MAG: diadenylate cyclase CdaA [Planctomycetales bacterium]|nr:diadenylate cyclase CdaA [Planctomycetales bacterium]